MDKITNTRLLDAVERNKHWIQKKCGYAEQNKEKRKDLYQDIMVNLLLSKGQDKDAKIIANPDHWVKKVTSNVTSNHIRDEIREREKIKKLRGVVDNSIDKVMKSNAEYVFDLRVALNFINNNFEDRDREIMILYMMKEPHKEIAEVVGMTQGSVTNRVITLKKRLTDYLNKGDDREK